MQEIFKNNEAWVAEKLNMDANFFKELEKGQSPEILYIGCSDSRVTAEEMMGVGPGEVFVHRNIANMVPDMDLSSAAVVEYAVKHLEVKHVVVCGHYGCGGVKAAMGHQDLGILNPWLRKIRDVYRTHKTELNAIDDEHEKYKRLIELNVQEQCLNLFKAATVQNAIQDRKLRIHGWVFDIGTGKLIDLKIPLDEIKLAMGKIYEIK